MRISDWSSDVCSSDLLNQVFGSGGALRNGRGAADPFNISPGLDSVRVRTLENGAPSSPPAPAASGSNAISLGNTENVFISAELGRASWRERGCQYVEISVVAVSLKKTKT